MPSVTFPARTTQVVGIVVFSTMLLQSYAVFGEINQITDEITADNFALMTYFRDRLPTAAQDLGWND